MVLFAAAIVIVGVLDANRLMAAVTRNLGFLELSREITASPDDCGGLTFEASLPRLQEAIARQPDDATTWVAVLRLKGMTDRAWIIDRLGGRGSKLSAAEQQASDAAQVALMPKPWAAGSRWSYSRCQNAWDAWTLGLIDATHRDWPQAVAAYQAGIGLALGRVPDTIINEYYAALANDQLAQSNAGPDQKLATAKYLALSGDRQRAADLFRALTTESRLTPRQRCEAESGLAWVQAADAKAVPPWPIATMRNSVCVDMNESSPSPEWQVPSNQALMDANYGAVLIGFDLDRDVLEAGAEVIGVLYWQTPDGRIEYERMRQPNLWPNSGNNWLPLDGFWRCLPGYVEPPWVPLCASHMSLQGDNSVGYLISPSPLNLTQGAAPENIPDAYLNTTCVPLHRGERVVYGGRWQVSGSFPSPHVARSHNSGTTKYEVVLDLLSVPAGNWLKKVGVASVVEEDDDFTEWLRPRSGHGEGVLEFDDVFSFVLPELTP